MVSGKSGVNMSPSPPRGDAPVYKYHINYIHRFVVINVIIIINKNDNIIKLFLGRRHTISVLTSFFRFFLRRGWWSCPCVDSQRRRMDVDAQRRVNDVVKPAYLDIRLRMVTSTRRRTDVYDSLRRISTDSGCFRRPWRQKLLQTRNEFQC